MGHFYEEPKRYNDNALGYYMKLMGHYNCIGKKPITLWSNKIYPSEQHILNSFVQSWLYYFKADKQTVCCAYNPEGIYKFSFVRDPESGKITKIDAPSHTLPEHMLYYNHKFIPGQSKYPLSLDERDEIRKDLVKSKAKAKKTDKAKQ